MKTLRTLNLINQFTSGHQLTRQTQQSHNYNCKGRITMKAKNAGKDHPITNRDKEMAETTKKTLVTEIITLLSQKDMLQKVGPI